MLQLNREASALILAGREAFRPSAADRGRVLASLTRTLGSGVTGATATARPLPARGWVLGGTSGLVLGVTVAFGAWLHAARTPKIDGDPPSVEAPSVAIDPVRSPTLDARMPASPPKPEGPQGPAARRPAFGRALHSAPDSMPQEVWLLSKAVRQLNEGFPADALQTLSEHARRFPEGDLAEERLAVRIQALCALGRVTEGRAELDRLARTHPGSPYLERAPQACAAAPAPASE